MTQLTLHNDNTELGTFDLSSLEQGIMHTIGANIRELFPPEANHATWNPGSILEGLGSFFERVKDAAASDLEMELKKLEGFLTNAQANPGSTLTISAPSASVEEPAPAPALTQPELLPVAETPAVPAEPASTTEAPASSESAAPEPVTTETFPQAVELAPPPVGIEAVPEENIAPPEPGQ